VLEFLSLIWNEGIIRPMVNGLMLLYIGLFHNLGISILVFTALVRLITLPLTIRQTRQMRAMSQLQPRLQELQKKHAGDRQRISQETFRLYREHGVNPIGCLGPMVIQMPIWIGLYWALVKLLPSTPESLAGLSGVLYSSLSVVHESLPVHSMFLGMDLADTVSVLPLPANAFVALLVGGSMWLQQKMTTYPTTDPRQRQTNTLMLWMFPLMFAFLTFQFPTGLALYWVASNVIGVAIQYKITGWGGLRAKPPAAEAVPAPTPALAPQPVEEQDGETERGSDRQDRRRGRRVGQKATRRRTRGGRGRGH
jgi:YidC/Oxa1 family membrane protein insertase